MNDMQQWTSLNPYYATLLAFFFLFEVLPAAFVLWGFKKMLAKGPALSESGALCCGHRISDMHRWTHQLVVPRHAAALNRIAASAGVCDLSGLIPGEQSTLRRVAGGRRASS